MEMKNIELILNGKSGSNPAVREAVQQLRAEGFSIQVHLTWEAGDAARFSAQFSKMPDRTVVAGGGDGTVNEVLTGLLASGTCECAMGILPLGTANDFASSAGLPIGQPYEALKLAATVEPSRVDVGRMNDRLFLNVASGGFGAEVTANTPVRLKNALGGAAYGLEAVLMALGSSSYRGRMITPEKSYEGQVLMFAVGNGRQAGGGVQMTPAALINDAALDIMLVPAPDDQGFIHVLKDLARLKMQALDNFYHLRASSFQIEADTDLQINLDGEPVRGRNFSFGVMPKALQLVLPKACPLLEGH
jgi:lipid kinase YegS